mmetsp:Transcript_28750/g.66777  ORF Transcript_28750/g.66777 Transcript_28750/m.66777 type:complete len:1400 (+) Transcript_28750:97-4296(+)
MASTGSPGLRSPLASRPTAEPTATVQVKALIWKHAYIAKRRKRWIALIVTSIFCSVFPAVIWRLTKAAGARQQVYLMIFLLPVYLNIAFQAALQSLTTELVVEKESKLKVLQELYGVSKLIYWLSWGVYYFFLCLPCIATMYIMMSVVTKVVSQADPLIFILILASAFAQQFGLAAMLSVLFSNLQSAARCASFVNLLSIMTASVMQTVSRGRFEWLYFLGNLLPFCNVYNGLASLVWLEVGYVCHGGKCDRGLAWNTLWASHVCLVPDEAGECLSELRMQVYPAGVSIVAMIADVFLYIFVAWYLESMLEHAGERKPLLFCFDPTYMCPRRQRVADAGGQGGPIPALEICNLRKLFKAAVVVDDLSLTVHPAEIFALLGHNGAGKTTAINCITGLLPMSGGTVRVNGWDTQHALHQARLNLSVCPQDNPFWDELTLRDHLFFFSALRGSAWPDVEERAMALVASLGLREKLNDACKNLSGGQMRRLWATTALLGRTCIAFLDEPTSGMDPASRRELWEVCCRERREGRTVLFTTHYLDEADLLADRKAVLAKGKVQALGTSRDLREQLGLGYHLRVEVPASGSGESEVTQLVSRHIPNAEGPHHDTADASTASGVQSLKFSLPFRDVGLFGPLLMDLDGLLNARTVVNYTLGATTLEDVFIALGRMAEELEAQQDDGASGSTSARQPAVVVPADGHSGSSPAIEGSNAQRRALLPYDGQRELSQWRSVKALAWIRILAVIGDRRALQNTLIVPALLMVLDMLPVFTTGQVNLTILAIYPPLGFSIAIVAFCIGAAKERQQKCTHVMLSQGLSVHAYWFGTILAHYMMLAPVTVLIPALMTYASFQGDASSIHWDAPSLGLLFIEAFVYPLQLLLHAHIVSFYLGSAEHAAKVLPILNMLFSVLPTGCVAVLLQFPNPDFQTIGKILHVIMSLANPFYGLPGMVLLSSLPATADSVLLWALPLCASPVSVAVQGFWLGLQDARGDATSCSTEKLHFETHLKDDDVLAEEQYVLGTRGSTSGDEALRLEDVHHTYITVKKDGCCNGGLRRAGKKTETHAVRGISLAVRKRQCFGLLGPNGAGKTTSIALLTGEVSKATAGRLFILDNDVQTKEGRRQASAELGVCPQADPLWESITGREHLRFYGRMKGVREDVLDGIVDTILQSLGIEDAAEKHAGKYSGGMKRKLSMGIAIIGFAPVVILDEPSTGMDVIAKRAMWRILKERTQDQTVLVTTHSMEEAEALCTTVAIQVSGQLRCLGTPLHIKNKYGSDYQLECLRLAEPAVGDLSNWENDVQEFVKSRINAAANLVDSGMARCVFQLPPLDRSTGFTLGRIYTELHENCGSLNMSEYTLTQPTLEQVFLRFARVQEENPEAIEGVAAGVRVELSQQSARGLVIDYAS